MDEARFDVQATIPPGGTRDQVPAMLQRLLAERFGLVTHREERDVPAYALVVGAEGPNLREAPPEAEAESTEPQDGSQTPGPFTLTTKTETAVMRLTAGENGSIQVVISRMTAAELARNLRAFVGRPVIDRTGLIGVYAVTLEMAAAEAAQMVRVSGNAGPGVGADTLAGPAPAAAASDPPGQSSMVRSVEKLGLRLESRRMPIEVIVVDALSRSPTPH
jgi:uncharacterized protein (TIGR03435 family)